MRRPAHLGVRAFDILCNRLCSGWLHFFLAWMWMKLESFARGFLSCFVN